MHVVAPLHPPRPVGCGATLRRWGLRFLDFLYDMFSLSISVVDMVSDVLIAAEFYGREDKTYFWIAVVIFVIAQISYAVLFVMYFCRRIYAIPMHQQSWMRRHQNVRRIAIFLAVFPVAQAVPLFVWLESFQFPWLQRFMRWIGLDVMDADPYTGDELMDYLQKKMQTHGGFIVESVTESVPQSILQMIAIVVSGEVTAISVFSISISIISVASKGIMLSFSIDWRTFFFNFLCFVTDVVLIFCNVAWLFFVWEDATTHGFFLLRAEVTLPSLLWFWREVVVVLCLAVLGLLGLALLIVDEIGSYRLRFAQDRSIAKVFLLVLGVTVFGLVLAGPILVVVEAMTLSVLPLVAFNSLGSSFAQVSGFWRPLFAWLQDETTGPYKRKLLFVNKKMSTTFLDMHKNAQPPIHPTTQRNLACARWVMEATDQNFRLRDLREAAGMTFKSFMRAYASAVSDINKEYYLHHPGARCPSFSVMLSTMMVFWSFYVCGPVFVLSSLYSLAMPILAAAMTPVADMGLLQHVLTWSYLGLLAVLLVLLRPVMKFRRLVIHLITFGFTGHSWGTVEEIRQSFQTTQDGRIAENCSRLALLVANARCNRGSPLSDSLLIQFPLILELAGLNKHPEAAMDLLALDAHPWARELMQTPLPSRFLLPRRPLQLGADQPALRDDSLQLLMGATAAVSDQQRLPLLQAESAESEQQEELDWEQLELPAAASQPPLLQSQPLLLDSQPQPLPVGPVLMQGPAWVPESVVLRPEDVVALRQMLVSRLVADHESPVTRTYLRLLAHAGDEVEIRTAGERMRERRDGEHRREKAQEDFWKQIKMLQQAESGEPAMLVPPSMLERPGVPITVQKLIDRRIAELRGPPQLAQVPPQHRKQAAGAGEDQQPAVVDADQPPAAAAAARQDRALEQLQRQRSFLLPGAGGNQEQAAAAGLGMPLLRRTLSEGFVRLVEQRLPEQPGSAAEAPETRRRLRRPSFGALLQARSQPPPALQRTRSDPTTAAEVLDLESGQTAGHLSLQQQQQQQQQQQVELQPMLQPHPSSFYLGAASSSAATAAGHVDEERKEPPVQTEQDQQQQVDLFPPAAAASAVAAVHSVPMAAAPVHPDSDDEDLDLGFDVLDMPLGPQP